MNRMVMRISRERVAKIIEVHEVESQRSVSKESISRILLSMMWESLQKDKGEFYFTV